jgi:hypothetical protein
MTSSVNSMTAAGWDDQMGSDVEQLFFVTSYR